MKRVIALACFFAFVLISCTPTQDMHKSDLQGEMTSDAPHGPLTSLAEPDPTVTEKLLILISEMSLEEKVGQLFLARCPDTDAVEEAKRYHLGGYVLFARDVRDETPDSLKSKIAGYQEGHSIPLFIAVDEEGGTVTRVSSYTQFRASRFPSPRNLYADGGVGLIISTEREKCTLLSSLGINVNLSPVCDVCRDPDAFMYARSLGQTPEVTSEYVKSVISVMREENIGGVLKHFPGYGDNEDTHVGTARDTRSLDTLEKNDLLPFRAGIEAGAGAIMLSHTYIDAIDPDRPASLSPRVCEYLRKEMGFDGVIMTDDLAMGAITELYGAGESAVMAVRAGCDVICCSEYAVQYEAVLDAAWGGMVSREMLDGAVLRVLLWKYSIGLLDGMIK